MYELSRTKPWLVAGLVVQLTACTALFGPRGGQEQPKTPTTPEVAEVKPKPPQPLPPVEYPLYRVKAGDTLYSLSLRYDKDFRELAKLNKLDEKYTIYIDQVLRLEPEGYEASVAAKTAAEPPAGTTVTTVTTTVTTHPISNAKPLATAPLATGPAKEKKGTTPPVASSSVVATAPTAIKQDKKPAIPAKVVNSVTKTSPSVSSSMQAISKSGSLSWSWPVTGQLVKRFSSEGVGSKGIDIAGKRGDPVKAASDGVVVYAGEGLVGYGKLIIIRHNDDYISAYAHNDRLIASEGQRVKLGQTIAEVGSTGAERDKLHFEIRYQGKPVDPLTILPTN